MEMPDPLPYQEAREAAAKEYLLVTDKTSEVLMTSPDRHEVQKLANKIRRAGGEVTIFKALNL